MHSAWTTGMMALVLVGATAAAEVQPDTIGPWCITGGALGAICSLHYFRVPFGPTYRWDIAWQFSINMILSAAASPSLSAVVCHRTGMPAGYMVAVPVSLAVGIIAQRAVAKWLPAVERVIGIRADRFVEEVGGVQVGGVASGPPEGGAAG